MGKFQEATVEFDGGSTALITQFWVPDDHIIAEAKKRLGSLSDGKSGFKVTIRRPLDKFEDYMARAAISRGKDG